MSRRDKDNEIEAARGVVRRAYWAEVESWATDLAKRLAEGEWDSADAFNDAVEEETDGVMIYTADAYECIYASSKSEDGREELVEMSYELSNPMFMTAWATCTFRLDLREHSSFPDAEAHFAALEEASE